MEPSLVISTICRACGDHIDIRDGKPVVRPKFATKLATSSKPPLQHKSTGSAPKSKTVEKESPLLRFKKLIMGKDVKRTIGCYHCKHSLEVSSAAQSSQCPKCGGHISLRDYVVDDAWRRRIQTRGNVRITKSGSILGVTVQCHDLTVLGNLSAPVDCSGKLMIRSHGKIIGNVKCAELRVERGAEVEFQGAVSTAKACIDGNVRAQLTCTGTITLEKKAHLQGPIQAAGLVVKEGAKHTGSMEVIKQQASV